MAYLITQGPISNWFNKHDMQPKLGIGGGGQFLTLWDSNKLIRYKGQQSKNRLKKQSNMHFCQVHIICVML